MCSNDTLRLGNTLFIFHDNQSVQCFCFKLAEHVSKLSSMGVLEEEEGGQQATCLVAKQAVEFPQVLASGYKSTCTENQLCPR